jgi:hypothetical protein
MGGVIKKFIPKTIEENYPKPILVDNPMSTPDVITKKTNPIKPNDGKVSATEGPSKTEVDMSSGMDGTLDNLNRKKKGRSKTILTSSQGLSDQANLVKPSLLG